MNPSTRKTYAITLPESRHPAPAMPIRETLRRGRTPTILVAIVAGAAIWLTVVNSHDPGGPYGESAAAWVQAIMSVGAILVAVVIDQGASRRDRQVRLEAAAAARAARLKALEHCASALDNAAEAAAKRAPKRGQRFDGLALEAILAARQVARHFADRSSDDDPILVGPPPRRRRSGRRRIRPGRPPPRDAPGSRRPATHRPNPRAGAPRNSR